MDTFLNGFLAVCIGLGLSAACGFRVFVPMLVMSIAVHTGHLHVAPGFEWIGSMPAVITLSCATLLEIGAYYIPGLDHFLDVVATPAAVVAGAVITASMVVDMDPYLRWTLAAIAGGGLAAVVQTSTVGLRAGSAATTFGFANPIVSTLELVGATLASIGAIMAPVLALGVILCAVFLLIPRLVRWAQRIMKSRPATALAGDAQAAL